MKDLKLDQCLDIHTITSPSKFCEVTWPNLHLNPQSFVKLPYLEVLFQENRLLVRFWILTWNWQNILFMSIFFILCLPIELDIWYKFHVSEISGKWWLSNPQMPLSCQKELMTLTVNSCCMIKNCPAYGSKSLIWMGSFFFFLKLCHFYHMQFFFEYSTWWTSAFNVEKSCP